MAATPEKAEVNCIGEDEVKWVNHYSSNHHILLVGEGDFSFSLSLATSFGSASDIIATSLDSYDDVVKKYKSGKSNLEILGSLGGQLIHGVDATNMKRHKNLQTCNFDRIVYNFPHAGFHGKEDESRVITMHRNLVCGFFRNASGMLRPDGEVHVTHKTSQPFHSWNLEGLAAENSLVLFESVEFKIKDYPGYNNKRGASARCDESFPVGACSTFKFKFSSATKNSAPSDRFLGSHHVLFQQPPSSRFSLLSVTSGPVMNPDPVDSGECERIFHEYFNHALSTFGQYDANHPNAVRETLRIGSERYKSTL